MAFLIAPFFFGHEEDRRITPAAQDGAAGSIRLLLIKNPAPLLLKIVTQFQLKEKYRWENYEGSFIRDSYSFDYFSILVPEIT